MTINNANVEQINVALLDLDKRIKALNIDNEAIKSLQNSVKTIKSSLNETKAGLQSGATYNINISGNATTATHATTATTAEIVNVAESAGEANHATTATTADKALTADKAASADEANYAKLAGNISAGGTSGQVLTSNGPSTAPSWQDQKFKTVKFVDYRTGNLTFNSLADQKKIELSNFGPDVTEDNVLSFMVIYWSGVPIIAQGDWAKSQGTDSSGLACALYALKAGTGWCVIRCVYLA